MNKEALIVDFVNGRNYDALCNTFIEFAIFNEINVDDLVNYLDEKYDLNLEEHNKFKSLLESNTFKTIEEVEELLGLDKVKELVPIKELFESSIHHIYKSQFIFPAINKLVGDDDLIEIFKEKNKKLKNLIYSLTKTKMTEFFIKFYDLEPSMMYRPISFSVKSLLSALCENSQFSIYFKVIDNKDKLRSAYDKAFFDTNVFKKMGNTINLDKFGLKIGDDVDNMLNLTTLSTIVVTFNENTKNNKGEIVPNFIFRTIFEALDITIFTIVYMHNSKFNISMML